MNDVEIPPVTAKDGQDASSASELNVPRGCLPVAMIPQRRTYGDDMLDRSLE